MNGPSYTPPSCLPLLCEPLDLPSELDEALTLPFTEEACGSSPLVGGKGSQLGLLSSIQHKVMSQGRLSPLSLSYHFVLFFFFYPILWNFSWGTNVFVVNPCPRIYIPTNVYTSICFIFINEIELATNEVMSPQTRKFLATHKHWPLKVQPFHSLSLILSYSPSNPVHGGTFSTLYCFPKFLITFHLTYM